MSSLTSGRRLTEYGMQLCGNHEAILHQWQPDQNHRMPPQQGNQRSLPWQQYRRMVPNQNWSTPRISALTLFNIILERIISDALEDHEGTVSIGGRTITKLHFARDIDGLAGQERELVKLVNHLEASTAYGMQISAEKTQLMTINNNGISTDITIGNKKEETVCSFN